MKKLILWIFANKIEAILICLIIIIALFFRFYKIDQYLTFLGDEGRDVIVVKNLITKGDLIFIGPTTSVGNMYLGPAYYYMMAPFLAIFRLSPVGPAVMVAVLSVVTIYLIYYFGKKLFFKEVGIFAAFLAAFSGAMIISSRSSWNPNPMPFFAIIALYSIYKFLQRGNNAWLVLTAASLAFVLQMHYLGLVLVPIIFIFWFFQLIKIIRLKNSILQFGLWTIVSLVVFILIMSPLIIFDLNPQHRFLNFNAFKNFFLERSATEEHLATLNLNPVNFLPRVLPLYISLFERFITAGNSTLAKIIAILVPVSFFLLFKKSKSKTELIVVATWLIMGIFGLSLYQLNVFDHYFGFLVPVAFLTTGIVLATFYQENLVLKIVSICLFIALIILNLQASPLKLKPNRQLQNTQEIARFIIDKKGSEPFNFALIAKNNYDSAYQYYFDLWQNKSTVIDDQNLNTSITNQLFVVCEDLDCQPLGYPKWEVAGFGKDKGLAQIGQKWDFGGVKIYKLIHSPQQF